MSNPIKARISVTCSNLRRSEGTWVECNIIGILQAKDQDYDYDYERGMGEAENFVA